MKIGIDFGTCFSSIAFMVGEELINDTDLGAEESGIPTIFRYSSGRDELYGNESINTSEAITNSEHIVRYMKRTLRIRGAEFEVFSGGEKFKIGYIVKNYLFYLISQVGELAIKMLGGTRYVEGVTITVPVGIASEQMLATNYNQFLVNTLMYITDLAEDKINILQEPVAAAISYMHKYSTARSKNQTILVFDLGGGTLDVSIVECSPRYNKYTVKVKEGDLNLGGNNWDEALGRVVLNNREIDAVFSEEGERIDFRTAVENTKKRLTYRTSCPITYVHNGANNRVEISRNKFENATRGLLNRAIEVTKNAIKSYSTCGVSAIDKIILVGGSSNMPQIRRRMIEEFGRSLGEENIITHNPSRAIAEGAAIFAEMKDRGLVVENIATHTYGFDGQRASDGRDMIYNLLFRGTPFDTDSKIVVTSDASFIPRNPNQKSILFKVYESDAVKGVGEDANWMDYGSGETKNDMEVEVKVPLLYWLLGRSRSFSCKVRFELDKNTEILKISIIDKKRNVVIGEASQKV